MKLSVFIHAQWNKYNQTFSYSTFGSDMTEYGYVLLEERVVEFETPEEKELRAAAAKALQKQASAIRAKAFVEAQEKDEEAQALLCLEYTPAEVEERTDDDLPF